MNFTDSQVCNKESSTNYVGSTTSKVFEAFNKSQRQLFVIGRYINCSKCVFSICLGDMLIHVKMFLRCQK